MYLKYKTLTKFQDSFNLYFLFQFCSKKKFTEMGLKFEINNTP